jgi:hypothetical protein
MQTLNINITINHVYEGYKPHKSVVNHNLAYIFPNVKFEEALPELDHAGDIDYLGHVGDKAFGIQIKPITAKSNFGNYSPSERMKAGFKAFSDDFGGKVFIVFSNDGEIGNKEIIEEINQEIIRLVELAATK